MLSILNTFCTATIERPQDGDNINEIIAISIKLNNISQKVTKAGSHYIKTASNDLVKSGLLLLLFSLLQTKQEVTFNIYIQQSFGSDLL